MLPPPMEVFRELGRQTILGSMSLHLGETMRRLAEGGPREFYEGSLARDIVADLQAGGST
ncbi:MAG: gamma-glutamyltransferase, partial [Elusimicrobia bacterium]|nr:gamma-glutamyltransferase [Elusimicrobiota bacterium]